MRQAIVTGAEGFLGRHLVRELRRHGVHVTALGRLPGDEASYVAMGDAPWPTGRLADIIETTEPDAIFHLVGGKANSATELEQLNVGVAMAVMQAVRDVQVRPVMVFCGSAAEYGSAIVDGAPVSETADCQPTNAYGAAKLAQTNAALAFAARSGTPVLITRIFNPIGPGMPSYLALADFARQIATMPSGNGKLQTGNIHIYRDFIDVDHLVAAMRSLARNPDARGIINVCSGVPTELNVLVGMLIEASGKSVTVETDASRLRAGEPGTVVGSTLLLRKFGAEPQPGNYADVMARIWQDARMRWPSGG